MYKFLILVVASTLLLSCSKKQKKDNSTKVTWGFNSEVLYPTNFMLLFANMEDSMGETWDNGLSKLEKPCVDEYKK